MADSLSDRLSADAAQDRDLLNEARDASNTAKILDGSHQSPTHPPAEVVRDANAMRIVELGEAVKKLVGSGLIKRDQLLGGSMLAKVYVEARDEFAHPERGATKPAVAAKIVTQKDGLRETFLALQKEHPGNADIQSALDAVTHLSGSSPSPTVWRDASHYMQVVRGGKLDMMSGVGKNVLNRGADNLVTVLKQRRDELTHGYLQHQASPDVKLASGQTIETALSNGTHLLSLDDYRHEAIGGQREPAVEDTLAKWMKPEAGSPEASFGSGRAFVVSEFMHLAKTNASAASIKDLDNILLISKKGPQQIQSYMAAHYPEGIPEDVQGSIARMTAATQNDFAMKSRKATHLFSDAENRVTQVPRSSQPGQIAADRDVNPQVSPVASAAKPPSTQDPASTTPAQKALTPLANHEASPPTSADLAPAASSASLVSKLHGINKSFGYGAVAINLIDAAIKGDKQKAEVVVGSTLLVEGGTRLAAPLIGARALPIVGQMIGGGFAAADAVSAAGAGNTGRFSYSAIEASLYGLSAGAGLVAATDFWNPTVVAPAAVSLGSLAGAVTMTSGRTIYDHAAIIKSWFANREKNPTETSVADEKRIQSRPVRKTRALNNLKSSQAAQHATEMAASQAPSHKTGSLGQNIESASQPADIKKASIPPAAKPNHLYHSP